MNRCHRLLSHIFRSWGILLVMMVCINLSPAQDTIPKPEDHGFQLRDIALPKNAPNGYVSLLTVKLNKPLNPKKAYEIGFWIIGKQLKDQEYSYPIAIFPSNSEKKVNQNIFDLVESDQVLPSLTVNSPPSFSYRGHFTFTVRPDKKYQFVTVALKHNEQEPSPINLREDVTITGAYVKPLPKNLEHTDSLVRSKPQNTPLQEEEVPAVLAKRQLLDSKKSYTISESSVRLGLYDHRNIDSDVVTIYLNDKMVVNSLPLKRKKKFYDIELRPGKNTITLYAENLGEVAPNTAAILIKGSTEEFMAVLESDLGQSQFFTLVYEPKK